MIRMSSSRGQTRQARNVGISSRFDRPPHNRYSSQAAIQAGWDKVQTPGGKKLYYRIVISFTLVAMLGISFLVISAVYVGPANKFHNDNGMAMPLLLCIMGMVCGTLMIFGSLVLAKLMVSKKWRNNQQPTYPRPQQQRNRSRPQAVMAPSVHFSRTSNGEPEVDIQMPPPYEATLPPPSYTTDQGQSPIILAPPTYAESVNEAPPKYEQFNPIGGSIDEEAGHGSPVRGGDLAPQEGQTLSASDIPAVVS